MSSQHTSGAQIVLDALAAEGVDVAFGYPGGTIMPVHDAFHTEQRIKHVLVRHEQGAAFAAGGYARTTGKVGVCIATSGPGATNLVTGICDAMMDSVPVVAITGQVRSPLMGTDGFQEADVAAITQTITKRNIVVRNVESIASAIHAAFELARGPRPGPVLVDIPTDVLRTKIEMTATNGAAGARQNGTHKNGTSDLDEAMLESAIDLICEAKRPLAIVGGGARISDAVASYRKFMALLNAPHTSTINGLGSADPGDPNFLGMCGMHGWKAANKAIGECDLILALGMRFDDRVTGRTDRFARQAKIIHADIDASEFNKIIAVDVALQGDLDATLRELTARLSDRMLPDFSEWRARVAELHAPLPTDRAEPGMLSATDVLDAFFELAPPNVVVTVDVGQHQMWAAQRAKPLHPRHFISSSGLGAMGFGLPASIGAQLAHPEKPVVAIVGDGGLQMTINEFATIIRHELPVKILLIDNKNLGMVRQWQQLFYEKRYSATSLYDNPDFVAIAKAYGIDAAAVGDASELRPAITALLRSERPMLLHAQCFPNECVFPMIPAGAAIDEMIDGAPV
jgi:acetolactate synthase I/II/III large subunit